jgi:hypothetical protein
VNQAQLEQQAQETQQQGLPLEPPPPKKPRTQAGIGLSEGAKAPMRDVRKPDLVDFWTRFARLRGVKRAWWLGSLGWALVGAGLAAWSTGEHFGTFQVVGLLVLGLVLVGGDRMLVQERTENVENICNDFGRYLARWSEGPEHEMSAEYKAFLQEVDKLPKKRRFV